MPSRVRNRRTRGPGTAAGPGRRVGWVVAAVAVAVVAGAAGLNWSLTRWSRLAVRAEAAMKAGDFAGAASTWSEYNRGPDASHESLLAEARASLALGRAGEAMRALERATAFNPANPEPWLLRLEVLRVEDRPTEALRTGWEAFEAVPEPAHRNVLKALTLALLADTPDELARTTLQRWVTADPNDVDAEVALLRRFAASPRDGDPSRADRIEMLSTLLRRTPSPTAAREVLLQELADAGASDQGKPVLDGWPEAERDARYDRLAGRWALEFNGKPAEAVAALERALTELPHDWKIHYRLARAYSTLGRADDARREARRVTALRDTLDPGKLGKRLDADLARLDEPASRRDLAELCRAVGLDALADRWQADADRRTTEGALLP